MAFERPIANFTALVADGALELVGGLALVESNLIAADGTVTARDTPGDKCRVNCHGPLWRVSWKDEALENIAIGEQQVARAVAAEKRQREADLAPVCSGCAARKGTEASVSLHSRRDYQAAVPESVAVCLSRRPRVETLIRRLVPRHPSAGT